MPDYSKPDARNSTTPDPCTTIYWTGNILTDQQGNASFSFFTADQAANYTIIITATTAGGQILTQRLTISNTGKRH